MVFNWFRRQSNKSTTPQEEVTPAPVESQVPTEVVSSEPPEATAEYLNWAKAAYKNIQQQSQQVEVDASALPDAQTKAEVTDTASYTDAAEAQLPPDSVVPLIGVEASAPTPDTLSSGEPVANADPTASQEDAQQPATNPLPFWAKSEADRQARLERLKATAIEVPPVVPDVTQTTPETPIEIPSIAFDEGFLWSAEILAAQGRSPEDVSIEEITWLKKLRQGLDKTRRNIVNQLKAIVGQGPLNQTAVMEIEALLLQADVGVEATDYIVNALQNRLKQEALPADEAIAYLKQILRNMLDQPLQSHNPIFVPEKDTLNIWLITGVNGAGKTTTIGKIAHIAQKSGYKCLIGAADTFRAAAVEQVKIWGSRSGIEVIANPGQNTDPAAVVFDAIAAAQSRGTELLLIDTAGRLQNKKNLMDELSKIRRIVDKKAANAKVESLLVLDATLGQNGLRQAEVFAQAAQLSGVVLTKLDGSAKGGVALAVVQQLNLPIRFIGAGEGIEDLRPFSSYEFIEALLSS